MQSKIDPLQTAMAEAQEALQKAVLREISALATSPEQIAKDTADKFLKAMEKDAKRVMLAMMGFENRYGGWEVDHCNGRAGQSPIGDITRTIFQDMAVRFVRQHQDEIFVLTEKEQKSLINSMQTEFKRKISYATATLAEEAAAQWVKGKVNELCAEFDKFDIFAVTTRLAKANTKKGDPHAH